MMGHLGFLDYFKPAGRLLEKASAMPLRFFCPTLPWINAFSDQWFGYGGLTGKLRAWVGRKTGPIIKAKGIRFGDALPKTRPGKVMRRLLRSITRREEIARDAMTLENPAIRAHLQQAL